MKVSSTTAIVMVILGLIAFGLLGSMGTTIAAAMFLTYLFIVAVLITKPSDNMFMLLFMVAFFVFLLGRPMMTEITGYDDAYYSVEIPDSVVQHTYFLLTLSMLCVFVGYYISKWIKLPRLSSANNLVSTEMVEKIRYASKLTSLVFGTALLLINAEKAIYVSVYGYLESYLARVSNLPGFLSLLAELYPTSIAVYLATLPDRREIKWPIIMYVVVMGLYLLTGKRYEAVSAILLLVLYFVLRNKTDAASWFTRRHAVIVGLTIPFAMVFLISMETWRAGGTIDKSFTELMVEFFDSVGISSIVISYENMYHDELAARDVWFSFGNVWRSLNGNAIAQLLGGDKVYATQTVENALYGHSLSSAIMYKINPARMLAGGGIGSCYIAELMCDFSYAGVAIGSSILGIVMRKCSEFVKGNLIRNFLIVFIAMNMFRVPRDSFDFFFFPLFGIKNIMYFVFIYFLANARAFRITLRK